LRPPLESDRAVLWPLTFPGTHRLAPNNALVKNWLNKMFSTVVSNCQQIELNEAVTAAFNCCTHTGRQPQRSGLQVMTACMAWHGTATVLIESADLRLALALAAADGVMRSTK